MKTGIKNGYSWFQSRDEDLKIHDFRKEFDKQIIGKFVYITSLDSVPMTVSNDEKIEGWKTVNEIAISPAIADKTIIPTGDFCEWYIFESDTVELNVKQKFVNYFDFDLGQDSVVVKDFWEAIERSKPVVYISDGSRLTIVTSNRELSGKIKSNWR